MTNKLFFYHVSKIDHGEEFEFIPRVPETAILNKEGNIPRICVSTKIFYCLRSICSNRELYSYDILNNLNNYNKTNILMPPTIYAIDPKQPPFLPPDVSDFRYNEELWFLNPIIMKRIGYLDLHKLVIGKIKIRKRLYVPNEKIIYGCDKDVKINKPKRSRNNILLKYNSPFNILF